MSVTDRKASAEWNYTIIFLSLSSSRCRGACDGEVPEARMYRTVLAKGRTRNVHAAHRGRKGIAEVIG